MYYITKMNFYKICGAVNKLVRGLAVVYRGYLLFEVSLACL